MAAKGPLKPTQPGLRLATKTTESRAPSLTPKWGAAEKPKDAKRQADAVIWPRPARPKTVNPGLSSERTRLKMVERLAEQGIRDRRVLEAMRKTPRHRFVDEALASRAYEDTALPIGHGQTISQPYVVARTIELALQAIGEVQHPTKALEIGAGCGYQAAVMSACFDQVVSVERIKTLYGLARANLQPLKRSNLKLLFGDGLVAAQDEGPFDVILISAGLEEIPPELIGQCAVGGAIIAPLGGLDQRLTVIRKMTEDQIEQTRLDPVRYVPVLRGTE